MAASMKDPRTFFSVGTPAQYEYVFSLYEEAVKLKALQKNKKVADILKLDKWYQTELPKRIKSRGKDAHLVHEELVQCMKWKLARGKFSPRIKDLVQMNTPRLCITETKKAFRALLKKDDLSAAIQALCNLKGVGPAMASVMLTAAHPEACGFMADECLLAIPEIEGIDYTTKELLNFVEQLKTAANRLNSSGGSGWNAHRIEQTLWAHFILNEHKKELLDDMPSATTEVTPSPAAAPPTGNGTSTDSADNANQNGGDGESSSDSVDSSANKENVTTNSNGTSGEPRPVDEDDSNTNDTITNGDDSNTNDSMPSNTVLAGIPVPANSKSSSAVLPPQEDTNDSIATSGCSGDTSPAPLGHEEDSVNTASPPQQVSDDTNDSLPQQSNQQKPIVVEAASAGGLSNGSTGAAPSAAVAAVTPMDEDTNDSLAMSESTCDSVPEVVPAQASATTVAPEKLSSTVTKAPSAPVIDSVTTASFKDSAAVDDGDTPEPAAKKAKLDVE